MHGPCGTSNVNAPCTEDKQCTKRFPKRFNARTRVEDNGYPVYIRRDTRAIVEKNGVFLDNRFGVPYNAQSLFKYSAHINVEWCNQSRSIKYLLKYINKAYDRVTTTSYHKRQNSDDPEVFDEIKMYYGCWYICKRCGGYSVSPFTLGS